MDYHIIQRHSQEKDDVSNRELVRSDNPIYIIIIYWLLGKIRIKLFLLQFIIIID